MKTFAAVQLLKPGDVIVTPKSQMKIVEHYVIYVGVNQFGQEVYLENNNIQGVRAITGEQFASENPFFFRINRFVGSEAQRDYAIQFAISKIGTKYNLVNYNCEHFANQVQHNVSISKQVNNVAASLLFVGIIATALGVTGKS